MTDARTPLLQPRLSRAPPQASDLFSATVELVQKLNRRSLDHLSAKVYFYLGRVYELQGRDADLRPCVPALACPCPAHHPD